MAPLVNKFWLGLWMNHLRAILSASGQHLLFQGHKMESLLVNNYVSNVHGLVMRVLDLNLLFDLELGACWAEFVDNNGNFEHFSHGFDLEMVGPSVTFDPTQICLPIVRHKVFVVFWVAFKVFLELFAECGHIPTISGCIEFQYTVVETAAIFGNIHHCPSLFLGS